MNTQIPKMNTQTNRDEHSTPENEHSNPENEHSTNRDEHSTPENVPSLAENVHSNFEPPVYYNNYQRNFMYSRFNEQELRKALRLLKPNHELFEIRFIGNSGKLNFSGYFTDTDILIERMKNLSTTEFE